MIAIALLAAVPIARIDVAFIGRFYYRPGINKLSRYYVYGVDLKGRHRIRLSRRAVSAGTSVRWVDRNTVAWGTTNSKWSVYDVRTQRNWSSASEPKSKSDEWPENGWDGSGTITRRGQPSVAWTTAGENGPMVLTRETVTLRSMGLGRILKVVPTPNPDRTIAMFGVRSANGMEDFDELLLFDWAKREVLPWHRQLKETQFYPDRDLFLARHEGMSLMPYGHGGHVRCDPIYAGTLSGNRMWKLVGGTVWCGAPALRPLN